MSKQGEFEHWWGTGGWEEGQSAAKKAFYAGYAVGLEAAKNGPTCHKCGKLVETGDVLCDEHEQEMIKALIAASKAPASGQKG